MCNKNVCYRKYFYRQKNILRNALPKSSERSCKIVSYKIYSIKYRKLEQIRRPNDRPNIIIAPDTRRGVKLDHHRSSELFDITVWLSLAINLQLD